MEDATTWETSLEAAIEPAGLGEVSVLQNFLTATKDFNNVDITIATQCDMSRLEMVAALAKRWNGPMSAAVVTTQEDLDATKVKLTDFFRGNNAVSEYVSFQLVSVGKQWERYPINLMRNVAKNAVRSDWTYTLDVDEYVSGDMWQHMKQIQAARQLIPSSKQPRAYVIRSFEWKNHKGSVVPNTIEVLRKQVKNELVSSKAAFFSHAYDLETAAPLQEWLSSDRAQILPRQFFFEPYMITLTSETPDFDTRFAGFGGNKNTLAFKMQLENWEFALLPNLFTFADETDVETASNIRQDKSIGVEVMHRLAADAGCENDGCRVPNWWPCLDACVQNTNRPQEAGNKLNVQGEDRVGAFSVPTPVVYTATSGVDPSRQMGIDLNSEPNAVEKTEAKTSVLLEPTQMSTAAMNAPGKAEDHP